MLGFVFDIISLIIIACFVWRGYKKGLVGLIYGILAVLLSIIISFVLYIPISNFIIKNTVLDDNIEKIIEMRVSNKESNEEITKDDMNNASTILVNYANKYINEAKNEGIHIMSVNISESIVRAMVWVVLYILSRIILVVLKNVLKILTDLPIIKQCNKIGGIFIGTLKGLIILYVILAIISLIAPLNINEKLITGINQSLITNYMYNNNLLLMLILK